MDTMDLEIAVERKVFRRELWSWKKEVTRLEAVPDSNMFKEGALENARFNVYKVEQILNNL
jgi:hypothetical protein